MGESLPWWFPVRADTSDYTDRLRADYPDKTEWSDDQLLEYFNEGRKYECLWDHIGDAYEQFEHLADAYLELLEKDSE